MRIFAHDLHLRVAEVAGNPGPDRHRQARLDQLRGLLDVQLDPCPDRSGFQARLARPHIVDGGPAFGHVLGKGATRVDALGLERSCREDPEGRAAADVGDLEPDALLGPDCRGRDIAARPQPELLQAPDRDKPGDDTGRPVEVAAIANGVEMRSRHEARRTSVRARQRHEEVGRVITAHLEAHGFGARCDQPVRELLAWPIGIAGHAIAIAAAGAQLIEQRRNVRFWDMTAPRISDGVGAKVCLLREVIVAAHRLRRVRPQSR